MTTSLIWLLSVVGLIFIGVLLSGLVYVSSCSRDKEEEDREQMEYLKTYSKKKGLKKK